MPADPKLPLGTPKRPPYWIEERYPAWACALLYTAREIRRWIGISPRWAVRFVERRMP